MSENLNYWIWLQNALGYCAGIDRLLEDFSSAKELYQAGEREWMMSAALTSKQVDRLRCTPLGSADDIIKTCLENGWKIVDYDDPAYPNRLKEISNPPAVLYVDGALPDIDSLVTIAIVGTRRASDYSVRVAHIMSKGITEAGALVVSGGALGIDTYAHRGALAAGGKTVAVLGCGLGTKYLMQNESLRSVISKNGALVTEFQPFTPAAKTTFPMRNRIISGLSLGVLVVEAGVKSGSLITAEFAAEQNRDIYAVPTSVISHDFIGTNRLIDDGAKIVLNPENIIEDYVYDYDSVDLSKIRSSYEISLDDAERSLDTGEVKKPASNAPPKSKDDINCSFEKLVESRKRRFDVQNKASALSGDEKVVYDLLTDSYGELEDIADSAGLAINKVLSALTRLEILGLVSKTSGKRFKKL